MPDIKFTVYGEPVAYDPEKSKSYKQIVRGEAVKVRPAVPLAGAISLTVKVYRSILKSFSKKKTAAAISGEVRPITKPDLDNVIKGFKDALKSIIWRNDSQVFDLADSGKWYSDVPRVEITVRAV